MEVDDSCLQFYLNIGDGGGQGTDMNFLNEWIQRRGRKKKIRGFIRNSVKIGDFTGTSGKKLNYYIDPLIANSTTRMTIIKGLYDLVEEDKNIIFAGPQTCGAILASEMALFRKTDAIIFNLDKDNVIYPYQTDLTDKKVILVDDVITTGYTLEKCINFIKLPIVKIICIYNRSNLNNIKGIEVESIFDNRNMKIG
jgi:orotate phosphoribosyltransferase